MRNHKTKLPFSPTKLIVGLGNPDKEYEKTRHNMGFWFVESLAKTYHAQFKQNKKFHGKVTKININEEDVFLLMPSTFMNLSGNSVSTFAHYYQIPPPSILVVHDDLDLALGVARLKAQGGHGGHNGLRHIIDTLGGNHFFRFRFGIGRPIGRQSPHDYVLHAPTKQEHEQLMTAIHGTLPLIPLLVQGEHEKAMQQLHTSQKNGI